MSLYLSYRCGDNKEYLEYAKLGTYLFRANDNEIYNVTGCLSKCDKYKYTAQPQDVFRKTMTDDPIMNDTLQMFFYIPSGEHEVKEQVRDLTICVLWTIGHRISLSISVLGL